MDEADLAATTVVLDQILMADTFTPIIKGPEADVTFRTLKRCHHLAPATIVLPDQVDIPPCGVCGKAKTLKTYAQPRVLPPDF